MKLSEEGLREDYIEKVKTIKAQRNAVILSHNYQLPEVQDIADIMGDSLDLSRAAIEADCSVVVFCGVQFMAEIAAILNPGKIILLPVKEAGCRAADMITVERLKATKAQFPDAAIVCYVNSSAAIKAESDVCCTSRNAIEVVRSLKDYERVIFIPDGNLARWVQSRVPDKKIIPWKGFCPTHVMVSKKEIFSSKQQHQEAEFIAHPECKLDILALAHYVGGTGGMLDYVRNSPCREFIVGTEMGLIHRLKKENPGKSFYSPSKSFVCPDMKLTTLEKVVHALETMTYRIEVPEDIRQRAKVSLDRMLR
jgi:quinolinate synthase